LFILASSNFNSPKALCMLILSIFIPPFHPLNSCFNRFANIASNTLTTILLPAKKYF
jgi:hypothetical protein